MTSCHHQFGVQIIAQLWIWPFALAVSYGGPWHTAQMDQFPEFNFAGC
jgi:hypothetical protein